MPWSARPNWPAPASTPQRLMKTGKPKVSPYSSARASEVSLVAPYSEMGAVVAKVSSSPAAVRPAGSFAAGSGTKASAFTLTGRAASGAMEYTRLVESRMKPAWCTLQYSSRCTVPSRLWSTSSRELVLPSTPASTLALAAASITKSAAGRAAMAAASRRSAVRTRAPRRSSGARLVSLPGRM